MLTTKTVSSIGIIGVLLFVMTTFVGSLINHSYNSSAQLISELYAVNAPNAYILRFVGYIPSGILITVFSFYSIRFFSEEKLIVIGLLSIGLFYGLGTVICSLYTLDELIVEKIHEPSSSETIHQFIGLLTYLITPLALLLIGIGIKNKVPKFVSVVLIIFGVISSIFVMKFLANLDAPNIGITQRIIEGSILLSITVFSFYLRGKKATLSQSI